jgi:hypothetical protein
MSGKFKGKRPFGGPAKIITEKQAVKVLIGLDRLRTGSYVGNLRWWL